MQISDVRHQPRAQRIMQRTLAGGRMPHACIFCGPEGVGKEMFAVRLAQLLLCESPVEHQADALPDLANWSAPVRDACGKCRSCHLVEVGNHPDLHLIHRQLNVHHPDPAVRKRKAVDLGVDVVRHFVIEPVGRSPCAGDRKVFIIRESDRITAGAQNALLKTLEEPPVDTFLMLLVESSDRLLATTRSRCAMVPFGPLPGTFVAEQLRRLAGELSNDDARFYAAVSDGSMGRAVQFVQDDVAATNNELVDILDHLDVRSAAAAAKQILDGAKSRSDVYRKRDAALSDTQCQRQALRLSFLLMSAWYRDLLHAAADDESLVANRHHLDRLRARAKDLPIESIADCIDAISQTEWRLDMNVNVQLCVESLAFDLARRSTRHATVVRR